MDLLAQAAADAPSVFTAENFGWLISHSIVAAIAGWLGGMASRWLDRSHQGRIDERLRKLESSLSVSSHIQRGQYEKEIAIYGELWQKADDAFDLAETIPFLDDVRKRIGACEAFHKKLVDLRTAISRHQPFYSDLVQAECRDMLLRLNNIHLLEMIPGLKDFEDTKAWAIETKQAVREHRDAMLNAIRCRLGEISSVPFTESSVEAVPLLVYDFDGIPCVDLEEELDDEHEGKGDVT